MELGLKVGVVGGALSGLPLSIYAWWWASANVWRPPPSAFIGLAPLIVALVYGLSVVLGGLLGSLYGRLFGPAENKAKAFGVALLYLAAFELLVRLPGGLVHVAVAASSAIFGAAVYLLYVRGFDPRPYLEELGEEELMALRALLRRPKGVKLRELASELAVRPERLHYTLARLEELRLALLDLDKRYRLTEVGRIVASRASSSRHAPPPRARSVGPSP